MARLKVSRWSQLVAGMFVVGLVASSCSGRNHPRAITTPRPVPAAVAYRLAPDGVTLGDPAFQALSDATADFGHLGGSAYQIEVPNNWSGRLVLFMHRFQNLSPTATVEMPRIRRYLVRNGVAWAASSYSGTGLIPGRAADETAALWDYFVQKFSRPTYAYLMGESMGGAAASIAAERYGDRFDGALALCGYAGQSGIEGFAADYFASAGYVAGITQEEFDSADVGKLIDERIVPALRDPSAHQLFEAIITDLTGGLRPLEHAGLLDAEADDWATIRYLFANRVVGNKDRIYRLQRVSGLSSDDFNRRVLRFNADEMARSTFNAGNDISGELQVALLSMHTGGDLFVPISQEQSLRRTVDAAGGGDLLVQRVIRAAEHCGFTDAELESSFDALTAWVERGVRPSGDDVLASDLGNAGTRFTLSPRLGSPEADSVRGANERVTVAGTLTLDDKPVDGPFLGVLVRQDQLSTDCTYAVAPVTGGHYSLAVPGDRELPGCGRAGATLYLYLFVNGRLLFSRESATWPEASSELEFAATFSSADAGGVNGPTTLFAGALYDANGRTLGPGTVVESYIGAARCGVATVPPITRAAFASYVLPIAGPDSVPGCQPGASISFRVNGAITEQTATNSLDSSVHLLDLSVR